MEKEVYEKTTDESCCMFGSYSCRIFCEQDICKSMESIIIIWMKQTDIILEASSRN